MWKYSLLWFQMLAIAFASTRREWTGSLARCPDPAAYERANYMQILRSWRMPAGW